MTVLFLILITANGNIATSTTPFSEETLCLQAIQKLVDLDNANLIVKARCIKQQ